MNTANTVRKQIRLLLVFFLVGLVLSGATAIPLQSEFDLWVKVAGIEKSQNQTGFNHWILVIRDSLKEMNGKYPFLAYGTDWLAFAHFVIAIAFIGPLRDPIKNRWVIEFGMISCMLIVPFALIMGGLRGIPLGWRLMDCSFGVFGIIPLYYCRRLILKLEELTKVSDE